MIKKLIILNKQKMGALQLIQISEYVIRAFRNMSFARRKFSKWRSALIKILVRTKKYFSAQ